MRKFWLHLEEGLALLYHDLTHSTYTHGSYYHFIRYDQKRRDIYVAAVRDRVVHQVLADYLEMRYLRHFFSNSFASQQGKGVHAARQYVLGTIRRLLNHRVWIAKLDVEKYFANVDHAILMRLLARRIRDPRILDLCKRVIDSFSIAGRGIPLGNLTSQWFANVYLHELDWHAKQILGIKYYMRYNDDIIVVSSDEVRVREWSNAIVQYAGRDLKLPIPPRKQEIISLPSDSIDVLGVCTDGRRYWIREVTRRKSESMLLRSYDLQAGTLLDTMCSYYGNGITEILQEGCE